MLQTGLCWSELPRAVHDVQHAVGNREIRAMKLEAPCLLALMNPRKGAQVRQRNAYRLQLQGADRLRTLAQNRNHSLARLVKQVHPMGDDTAGTWRRTSW